MGDWGTRAAKMLAELAQLSEPGPGTTRLPFTKEHRAALDILTRHMTAAGLEVALDAAGTLVGRAGGPAGAGTLLMGSHQDSVRAGGAYDGIMGVVLPLLALAKLRQEGVPLPCNVEVLAFADEEGVRFPTALVGSRALAGTVDPAVLEMADAEGISLRDAMRGFGLSPDRLAYLRRDPNRVIGFVETHIEQGPVLERAGEALGIVTAICGIERHRIVLCGETGHAGTLPMQRRRDALVGAAALVTEVNRLGTATPELRATVGALTVTPNVVNAVPGKVTMTAEFRSPDDEVRRGAGQALHARAADLADATGLQITAEATYAQPAQPCAPDLSQRLRAAAISVGSAGITLASGATHDASAMADLCPVAMLFLRCREGISHRPEEFASGEDMGLAVSALAEFLKGLPDSR